jgi:hypothetical protein
MRLKISLTALHSANAIRAALLRGGYLSAGLSRGADSNFAVDEIAALVDKFGVAKGAGAFQAVGRKLRLLRQEKVGKSIRDRRVGESPPAALAS